MFSHYFQIIINFQYVRQSVSWLIFLLKLDKCRNISCSGQDIFMKIFGDIPRMFLHYSQMITHFQLCLCPLGKCGALHLGSFTYCVPVSLPPSLCPSGRKLEISVNIDARTLKFCMRHPWTHSLRFRENQIVCMSVSLLVGLLPY